MSNDTDIKTMLASATELSAAERGRVVDRIYQLERELATMQHASFTTAHIGATLPALIANDSYAMSFQSMAQYRTALLNAAGQRKPTLEAQEDYVLAPTVATAAMCQAGQDSGKNTPWSYARCYAAMLAAATHPRYHQMILDIRAWQDRMPAPRAAYACSMNCSGVGMGAVLDTGCGDCMPITVHADPVVARDAEIADLRAALAQAQAALTGGAR